MRKILLLLLLVPMLAFGNHGGSGSGCEKGNGPKPKPNCPEIVCIDIGGVIFCFPVP